VLAITYKVLQTGLILVCANDTTLEVEAPPDCRIMNEFVPSMFEIATCCQYHLTRVVCDNNFRVISITIAPANKVPFPNGLPESLGQLEFLKEFTLISAAYANWGVQLHSPFPQSFGNLTNLIKLSMELCNLKGALPLSFGNLIKLTSINLARNDLSGSISPSLGSLQNLIDLNLRENQLSGEIPSSLGFGLKLLDLSNNQLNGTIPPSFGNLSFLTSLNLGNNLLSGQIPSELGNCALKYLNLNRNKLSGQIPSELGNLDSLEELYLSNNQLIGEVPLSLGDLPALITCTVLANDVCRDESFIACGTEIPGILHSLY
jgi:Leucine-rich repeat (LRR) protein